jgi:hypothetical protein
VHEFDNGMPSWFTIHVSIMRQYSAMFSFRIYREMCKFNLLSNGFPLWGTFPVAEGGGQLLTVRRILRPS